jgi:hypothetical protein
MQSAGRVRRASCLQAHLRTLLLRGESAKAYGLASSNFISCDLVESRKAYSSAQLCSFWSRRSEFECVWGSQFLYSMDPRLVGSYMNLFKNIWPLLKFLFAEALKRLPEFVDNPEAVDAMNHTVGRSMGAEQGDSTGDEGTSSDSDAEEGCGVTGVVEKMLQTRRRFLYLTSLKQLCLKTITKNISVMESSQRQLKIFQRMGI